MRVSEMAYLTNRLYKNLRTRPGSLKLTQWKLTISDCALASTMLPGNRHLPLYTQAPINENSIFKKSSGKVGFPELK